MLRKFYVHNFKTLLNFTFEPKGINLLIGRNNVGKTNLCQALRFFVLSAWRKLADAAFISTGSVFSIKNKYVLDDRIELSCAADLRLPEGGQASFEYSLRLVVAPQPFPLGTSLSVESESLRVTGGGFESTELIRNLGGQAWVLNEPAYRSGVRGQEAYLKGPSPNDSTVLATLFDTNTHPLANLFKTRVTSLLFYDLESARLRNTEAKAGDQYLLFDGGNLASVASTLKSSDDRSYRELVALVRTLEPNLAAINFPPSPDPNHVFMVFEEADRFPFMPVELSNGTLRLLALSCILLRNRYDGQRGIACPLVVIEEPETGIFVGHLKDLFERFDPSGAEGQYIFTSHSPYFIDLFEPHLDSVFILKRERTHTNLVRPDPEKTRQLIAEEFSLGELHFREMLG